MDKKVVKPMDDGIRERAVGVPVTNNKRVCYAIKTLVKEVLDLFPETSVEYSNYDGRNTALDVAFDLTGMTGDSVLLTDLLNMITHDERVAEVLTIDYEQALVSMRANPRTQDGREPFGLADAYMVMVEGDEGLLAAITEAVDFPGGSL